MEQGLEMLEQVVAIILFLSAVGLALTGFRQVWNTMEQVEEQIINGAILYESSDTGEIK